MPQYYSGLGHRVEWFITVEQMSGTIKWGLKLQQEDYCQTHHDKSDDCRGGGEERNKEKMGWAALPIS